MGRSIMWVAAMALAFVLWRAVAAIAGRALGLIPAWGWGAVAFAVLVWLLWRQDKRRPVRVKSRIHKESSRAGVADVIDTEGEVISSERLREESR